MFDLLREAGGDANQLLAHFLSHPMLSQRIDAARAAADASSNYAPILDGTAWAALQKICD